jgi:hypothetical protein
MSGAGPGVAAQRCTATTLQRYNADGDGNIRRRDRAAAGLPLENEVEGGIWVRRGGHRPEHKIAAHEIDLVGDESCLPRTPAGGYRKLQ